MNHEASRRRRFVIDPIQVIMERKMLRTLERRVDGAG
jgi:hypothetical protein